MTDGEISIYGVRDSSGTHFREEDLSRPGIQRGNILIPQ